MSGFPELHGNVICLAVADKENPKLPIFIMDSEII